MFKVTVVAAAVALLPLAPAAALAKNYCVSGFPNTSYSLVGQGFTLPPKGKCKTWVGFNPEGGNWPTMGTGCTSSDGTSFSLTATTGAESSGFAEIDAITLALPAQTGTVVGQIIVNSAVTTFGPSNGVLGAICSTNTIPAASTNQDGAALLPGDDSVPQP